MRIAAVTGLAAEARIARRAGLAAMATGGGATRTLAAAERLLAAGADCLTSFGIAGGLDPALPPGSVLLPERVLDEAGAACAVDREWRSRVGAALHRLGFAPAEGDLLGARRAVARASDKAECFHRFGTIAVDLESQIIAEVAARAGRPFLALRVVADPAARDLPAAATIELSDRGRPRLLRIMLSVLRQPGQIPELLHVARDARQAFDVLARAAPALVPPV